MVPDLGVHVKLTAVSPAMLSLHFQAAWKRFLGQAAATSLTVPDEIDASQYQHIQRDRGLSPHHHALLRAFCTHAL